MDEATKDWIDLISKIVGFVGVATAALMAGWQVRKPESSGRSKRDGTPRYARRISRRAY